MNMDQIIVLKTLLGFVYLAESVLSVLDWCGATHSMHKYSLLSCTGLYELQEGLKVAPVPRASCSFEDAVVLELFTKQTSRRPTGFVRQDQHVRI